MVDLERRKRARLNIVQHDEVHPQYDDDESLSVMSSEEEDLSLPVIQVEYHHLPNSFKCPLTLEIMFDPVLDAEGNTYERRALLEWLKHNCTSPVSRQPLSDRMLVPNMALREAIHEYMGDEWVARKMLEHRQMRFQEISTSTGSPIRDKIDCFLKSTSHALGDLNLSLNEEGCCAFRYENVTIVLDVPENVGVFCFYTRDLIPKDITDPALRLQLYQKALEFNFLQGDTRGGCLSIRTHENGESELLFSYTDRVREVGAKDFNNILLNFVDTALSLRNRLTSGSETNDKRVSPSRTPSSMSASKVFPTTIG